MLCETMGLPTQQNQVHTLAQPRYWKLQQRWVWAG